MTTVRRVLVIVMPLVIGLAVVVSAVRWVSVPLTDQGFSCGTSLSEWQQGAQFPANFFSIRGSVARGAPVPSPTRPYGPVTTLCRGEARRRMAESGAAIALVAFGVVIAGRRRWGRTSDGSARPLMHPQWAKA
jgi:hypothetical protein